MANKSYYEFKPDYAIAPGETVAEVLESKNMTQQGLSLRTGLTKKTINEIINGKAPISAETAIKLETVFGVKASFWLNLEMHYQEDLARMKARDQLEADTARSKLYPYAEMANLGWVKKTRKAEEKAHNLRNFLGVASLELIDQMPIAANFRRHHTNNISFQALTVWLRKGELEAEEISTKPFSLKVLKEAIPSLRKLTIGQDENFSSAMQEICRECGVALTFVPHLPKTSINGATRWLSPSKVGVSLSLRYPFEDMFWFSFFHELGHILKKHSKKEIYISYINEDDSQIEEEANQFAADILIPPASFKKFRNKGYFNNSSIVSFAKEIGTSPGIVLGRLCKEKLVSWNDCNTKVLRRKFKFV